MSGSNDLCTSTTCSLAVLRVRHYRWQCGSDTTDNTPGLAGRAATAVHRTVRDAFAKPDDGRGRHRRW